MVFLNALQSMMSITLLSLIGYVLAWKGWISKEVEIFIPRFVTQIVIPPYLMVSVGSISITTSSCGSSSNPPFPSRAL